MYYLIMFIYNDEGSDADGNCLYMIRMASTVSQVIYIPVIFPASCCFFFNGLGAFFGFPQQLLQTKYYHPYFGLRKMRQY